MKDGKSIVEQAVKDAGDLRSAAQQAAMNEIIERMAPKVRGFVETALQESGLGGQLESDCGYGDKEKGEKPMEDDKKGEKPAELDLEALMSMVPGLSEMMDEPDAQDEVTIPSLGEGDEEEPTMEGKKKDEDEEEEKADEDVEISEDKLKEVYEGIAKAVNEVQVSKSFGDITKDGELDEVDPGAGIVDVKKGAHAWEGETPPAKQDYSVKEIKQLIARGIRENKQLRSKLVEAVKAIRTLHGKLTEVNLFNTKVLHVNRILNRMPQLTREQKVLVMNKIDEGKTLVEVATIYEALTSGFSTAQKISEGKGPRKPTANANRVRSAGGNDKVLRESVDRTESDKAFSRFKQLAGLLK